MKPTKNTVGAHLVRVLGWRRALMVETFVMLWSLYAATEGHDPERIEDLADVIGRDRSTLFRWQADFREAFPEWGSTGTPRDLLDHARRAKQKPVSVREVSRMRWAS